MAVNTPNYWLCKCPSVTAVCVFFFVSLFFFWGGGGGGSVAVGGLLTEGKVVPAGDLARGSGWLRRPDGDKLGSGPFGSLTGQMSVCPSWRGWRWTSADDLRPERSGLVSDQLAVS